MNGRGLGAYCDVSVVDVVVTVSVRLFVTRSTDGRFVQMVYRVGVVTWENVLLVALKSIVDSAISEHKNIENCFEVIRTSRT